ncbi:hypothetical protein [Streptomyces sp. DT171]|uniref:hypothetical protein n=1 Tax=Streptomyces sp. DT171 TaxID=3416524 RepID=UPI003CEF1E3F
MPRTAHSAPRRGRLLRTAAAFVVLLALVGYLTVQYITGSGGTQGCVVRATGSDGDGRTYRMSTEQAANAATISAVGTTRGMPERAVTIALATAIQESGLRNIRHGDRDSLGLFQQRPSQGWGDAKQILDPVYSAGRFYERLAEIPGYSRLPLTAAAQRVQRSGFPQAYAKHEPDAALLAAALTGRVPAALTCAPSDGTITGPGDVAKVRAALVRDFGKGVLPGTRTAAVGDGPAAGTPTGPASGPTGATTGAEDTHSSSDVVPPDALDVPVRAPARGGAEAEQRGWELAHWAVARAEALRIDRVSYAGRVWDAGSGWRAEPDSAGNREESASLGNGEDPKNAENPENPEKSNTGTAEVRIQLVR